MILKIVQSCPFHPAHCRVLSFPDVAVLHVDHEKRGKNPRAKIIHSNGSVTYVQHFDCLRCNFPIFQLKGDDDL